MTAANSSLPDPPCPQRKAGIHVLLWRPYWWSVAWLGAALIFAAPLAALNSDREANDYSIQAWFSEDGLPSNKIRAVAQTSDGYLWLATAQGIARFDGYRFTAFTGSTHPELRGGGFFAVLEAPDGSLWFGGDNGLFRWHGDHFERYTTEHGLAHNYVRALALARDGAIVACTRTGYSILRDGRIHTPGGVWKEVIGVTRSYLETEDGSILLGTDSGLWRVAGDTIEALSGRDGLYGDTFTSLLETADGSLWIGYSGGLLRRLPNGTREHFGPAQGLTRRIASLCSDEAGNIWIGTYGGLWRLSNRKVERSVFPGMLESPPIQAMTEGAEGELWVAAATGLFRIKDNVSRTIGTDQGLAHTSAYAVWETRDRQWWIGLWGGGVYRYDQTKATPLDVPESLSMDRILAFAETDGVFWIGAISGLYRHSADAINNLYSEDLAPQWLARLAAQPTARLPGLAHSRVNAIATDEEGKLWIATNGGLYHGNEGDFRVYGAADGLPGNVFKSVIRARSGDVWTTIPPYGAARLREGRWTTYLCGEALDEISPRDLYEDAAGNIWTTTEGGGLYRFKEENWRTFDTSDGLADDSVSAIVEDQLGHFWIASPRGVMRIAASDFDELDAGLLAEVRPRIFNRFDGLPAGETNHQGAPNALRTHDGRLLFATDGGVAVIQPRHVKLNSIQPSLHIERFAANGIERDLSQTLSVEPGSNDVEFHYTAISLLDAEKVRFRIRLEPLDKTWEDVGSRRSVRYNKLPPGSYTFRAIACNSDGVWNEQGASLAFEIKPRFVQTPWFIGLITVIGLSGAWGVYRERVRQSRRQLATLAELVAERTRDLQQENAERRRAEAELENSLSVLHATLESTIDGILVIDAAGKLTTFNRRFAIMWRIPLEDVTQRKFRNGLQWGLRQLRSPLAFMKKVQSLLARPEKESFDALELKDGRIIEAYSQPQRVGQTIVGRVWCFRDITERKQAEASLAETHQQLLAASRQAGMAEVATGVLHNVGNVLNSVNISATLVGNQLRQSKTPKIGKIAALLDQHRTDLPSFFLHDSRGKMVPSYLATLSDSLAKDHETVLAELEDLRKNIEHIKQVVAMQQTYAKTSGFIENCPIVELVEDALRMNQSSLQRHDVALQRDYRCQPTIPTDKHKVMQIVINLVRNAKLACDESGREDKRITARIDGDTRSVRISIIDNGVGIAPENLTRIFAHGFTTRKEGHGFGLHSSALAAKELGGSLEVRSDGHGLGATFILSLPVNEGDVA